jgi:hypothetical protein
MLRIVAITTALLFTAPAALAQKPASGVDKSKVGKPLEQEPHPARDFAPITAAIDQHLEKKIADARGTLAPAASDEDFLRRAFLDLNGRIPTPERAAEFLDSTDPDKRRKLIDELLSNQDFGRHFAALWKERLTPRDTSTNKYGVDRFTPWLADQFNRNRGWGRLAGDLIGIEGEVHANPQSAFLMANGESSQPKPHLLTASVGRLFLGVQIACAECHDHPFAPWKQEDFWGVAAYFARVRNSGVKGSPFAITETRDPMPLDVKNGGVERLVVKAGGAVVVPATGGNKGAGKIIAAKLLDGPPQNLVDDAALRPAFVEWMTAAKNPYFAKAFVNRTWSQLFSRGLVNPVDDQHADNPPSHPDLFEALAAEFVASDHDIKHLLRCVCNSKAYQRTSRSDSASPDDGKLFNRMPVKPIGPDAIYDSLAVVMSVSKNAPQPPGKPGVKLGPNGKPLPDPNAKPGMKPMMVKGAPTNPRDAFILAFLGQGDAEPGSFTHGIPQFLRRMNGEAFNDRPPLVDRLLSFTATPDKAVETLFLATLSRRPNAEEREVMVKYLAARPTPEDGYKSVLWILLNSGEFVMAK